MKKIIMAASVGLASVFALTLVGGYWFYQMLLSYGDQSLELTAPHELLVSRGTSVNQLSVQLEQQGLIIEGWKLKGLVKLVPELANIRSGLYEVQPNESVRDLLVKLNQGQEKIFSVTLVEGKSIAEWQQQFVQLPHLSQVEDSFNKVLVAQGDTSNLPEGKFFPDTYHYTAGQDVLTLLTQSYKKMQQELDLAWSKRDANLPLQSPYELLIMASIIEKETGQASERDWISAVFTNRLRLGMRLQTDPTVIYGMGERYNGNITRKDLVEETPFNTYRIFGLPPTPIAAPSRASLIAAAKPAAVNYLYFVSKNDGTHVFSSSLHEHNRAVNQYQRKQK